MNSNRFSNRLFFVLIFGLLVISVCGGWLSDRVMAQEMTGIRVNHIGYTCHAAKICRIENPPDLKFQVQTIDDSVTWKTVFTGPLVKEGKQYFGDFSSVDKPADYRIVCGTEEQIKKNAALVGIPFVIKDDPYYHICRMMAGFFTWQRCGSEKGWAGKCHQDPVPLRGTDQKIDMTGGYHQSGDLRCWAEGISLSLYGLLRFAELKKPLWDSGQIQEEIRWGCDYFLKLANQEGKIYDCQFVPIGYGPREYYPTPCNMAAHWNICALLARASVFFKDQDPDYAKKCLDKSEKIWKFVNSNSFFDKPYLPPVKDLPRGTQGERFYFQTCRGSASMISAQCGAALDLFRATKNDEYRISAKKAALDLMDLQIKTGNLKGAFENDRFSNEKKSLGFADCGYNYALWGPRVFIELIRMFPDDPEKFRWKAALKNSVDLEQTALEQTTKRSIPLLRSYLDGQKIPHDATVINVDSSFPRGMRAAWQFSTSSTTAARISLFLSMAGTIEDIPLLKDQAQYYIDYICGANPSEMSYITGAGRRQGYHNIFGQFFPSTPYIPGAVSHVLGGEYDMPSAGMLIWALAELKD